MRFHDTKLAGVCIIDLDPAEDARGFFARIWDPKELAEYGLDPNLSQCSISLNAKKGTLRGMHYQAEPHGEAKLVRCIRGSMFDVALDLRPSSPTFKEWLSVELSAENHKALYIPKGCAHGFQTIEDMTEVLYMISAPYDADSARGVRWDDGAFGITWPLRHPIMSDRDRSFPSFTG